MWANVDFTSGAFLQIISTRLQQWCMLSSLGPGSICQFAVFFLSKLCLVVPSVMYFSLDASFFPPRTRLRTLYLFYFFLTKFLISLFPSRTPYLHYQDLPICIFRFYLPHSTSRTPYFPHVAFNFSFAFSLFNGKSLGSDFSPSKTCIWVLSFAL